MTDTFLRVSGSHIPTFHPRNPCRCYYLPSSELDSNNVSCLYSYPLQTPHDWKLCWKKGPRHYPTAQNRNKAGTWLPLLLLLLLSFFWFSSVYADMADPAWPQGICPHRLTMFSFQTSWRLALWPCLHGQIHQLKFLIRDFSTKSRTLPFGQIQASRVRGLPVGSRVRGLPPTGGSDRNRDTSFSTFAIPMRRLKCDIT